MKEKEDDQDVDVFLLDENDIPGASLNGKSPLQLHVIQLKRWLVCQGAPVSGNKPQLIERYACLNIDAWIYSTDV